MAVGGLDADKVLRVGIAGYGVVGKRRRQVIDQHARMRTVAICDRTFEHRPYGGTDVAAHTHYRDLLKHDLDALFVCLSNDVAAEVTIAGIERGVHVFCEKPPGRNVADIVAVIEAEKRHPTVKLKYGFNHRYHDSVRDALKIIQGGAMGRVMNMRGVYGKSRFISYGQHSDWRVQREIAGGFLRAVRDATGHDETGRQPLEVPFKGGWQCLIEVIDVKDR
jgi:predicted dehydrogenase